MATFPHEYQYNLKDLTLISHTGKEINLYPQFVEFTFEETIFGTTLHGTIFVVESIDLPTMLPMIGEERIRISFTRLDENTGDELDPINFEMPIYSLYGKKQDGKSGKRQTYNLAYCSSTIFKNLNAVVSKSFKNLPYSDIVKNIYEAYLKENKPIEVEPTKNTMNYVVQNQRPIKAIKTICKRSTSAEGNGSFYVFFEDRDKFNFVTMRKLMKQEPIRTLYYGTKNLPTPGDGPLARAFKNLSKDMYNASTVKEESGFDILNSAMKGEGASSILTVDPIRRSFSFKTFDLRGQPQEQSTVQANGTQSPAQTLLDGLTKLIGSPAPLEFITGSDFASIVGEAASKSFTDNSKMFINPRGNLKVVIGDAGQDTQEYIASRDPNVRPYTPEEFVNQREAEKASFMKHVVSASLPGDPTIKVGSVVKFDIPEKTGRVSDQTPEELDKYLQGNYVVVSVAHIVTKESYKINVELMKNSPENDIQARDVFSEYGIRTDE